jgi:hypothetical protein
MLRSRSRNEPYNFDGAGYYAALAQTGVKHG